MSMMLVLIREFGSPQLWFCPYAVAAYGEFEGQHGQWCLLGVLLWWLSLILADGLFGGAQRPERRGFSWVAPIRDLHLAGWWYCCSARCWGFGTGVEFFMNYFLLKKGNYWKSIFFFFNFKFFFFFLWVYLLLYFFNISG